LAIQVAAKTVGFDIVPVIPMSGPSGVLSYLDYVYAGGKLSPNANQVGTTAAEALAVAPTMIKIPMVNYCCSLHIVVGKLPTYYITPVGSVGAYNCIRWLLKNRWLPNLQNHCYYCW
jgi:hypothetical protein